MKTYKELQQQLTESTANFDLALQKFVEGVQKMNDAENAKYSHNPVAVVGLDRGPKYIRVWVKNGPSRSVHCFIDRTNGNILKTSSWKAPTPNAVRGNILTPDFGLSAVNYHGPHYRR